MNYLDIKKKHGIGTNESETKKKTASGSSSYSDIAKKHGVSYDVDEKYINSFISDANSFMSADKNSSFSTWNKLGLGSRVNTVRGWLYHNKNNLDGETYKSLSDTVDSLAKLNDYYSRFKSEDEYKRDSIGWLNREAGTTSETASARQEYYQGNADRVTAIEEELPWYAKTWLPNFVEDIFLSKENEALRDEAEKLEAENRQYMNLQGKMDKHYIPITEEVKQTASKRDYSNASVEELNTYDAGFKDVSKYLGDGVHYLDGDGNVINSYTQKVVRPADEYSKAMLNNDTEGFYNSVIQDKLGMFLSASEDDLTEAYNRLSASHGNTSDVWANTLRDGDVNGWKQLTEDEITIYYYKLNTEGQEAAYKFLEDMTTELTRRETEQRAKEISEAPLLEQIALNAASIPMNVVGGAIAFGADATNIIRGNEINPYSRAHSWQNDAQAIRSDTAMDIDKLTGGLAIPLLDFSVGDAYQALMSGADSLAGSLLGGTGYGVLMGMGAASAEMKELYERGASTEQMFLGGILAGAAEMVFEKVSIDHFVNMGDVKSKKDFIINILKQGGIEASEEAFTEIANTITDAMVMGSQAEVQDLGTFVKNVVNAGLGGFLSGSGMGTVGATANYAQYAQHRTEHGQDIIDEGGADTLMQLALQMYGNEKSGYNATKGVKLASKVADKASAKNVGKLSAHMENTITKQNRTDIQKALVEKGLSEKDAKRVAEYLGSSKALTAEQMAEIDGNESIKAVYDELDNPHSAISERGRKLVAARLGTKIEAENSGELSLRNDVDVKERVSETGKTTITTTDENGKEVVTEVTIDKNNPIAKVKYVGDERIVYLNTDHGTVEASKVKYANEEEGLLYEAFTDMNPAFANAVIKNYDGSVPLQTYINGMREGMILYGMHNFRAVGDDISKNTFLADLSETDQAFALKLGRAYAKADAKNANKDLRRAIKNAAEKAKASEGASTSEGTQNTAKKGNVYFEEGAKAETHKQHKKIISLAKHLAKAIGIDIVFYDSRITGKKAGQGANGYFDADTDTIYLDLQNAHNDAKTIAYTLSHELVHFIKKWSPQKFNTFAEFLMEQYASHGVSAANLLKRKMEELNTTDADLAYEEMIADACETMLLDSNAMVKLMELRKSDLELFEKIKLHILKILNDIREAYKSLGYQPSSDEAKALLGMKDVLEKFYSMFEEAAVDATKTYQASENANRTVYGEASVDVGKTESGVKHQLKAHKAIGEASIAYNERHKKVHKAILQVGIESMYEMAEAMLPYLEEEGILPPDIPGKTIFKNGSYGKTGENTTLCVRTLTYEDFKDRVAEKIGRPLTVSESLLVSQKIYDIATEPQCIYCYVAADRKAYDEYLGEYWKAMDKYIKAMRKGGDSKALYTEYLAGRKDTDAQKKRWSQWESIAKSGKEYISASDLTTKRKRDDIIAKKNAFSDQIKDAQRYAQSASWAKTVFDYRAYKGDILKMTSTFVDMLNSEYGLRMYSFSDYTPAFIVENMQMIIDASVKGLKSLAYTKDTDYVEIFASTGQAINVSCFARWDAEKGTYVEDNRQGANWEKTKDLRKQYRNVGAVMVATNDAMVEWALKQDWVDVVIPYHIVKTGTTIANEYQWNNYTSESADRVGNKTANIYPTEHNNDFAIYSDLLKERGITPRFSRWYDKVESGELTEEQYMKLVNEVRLPASELSPVVPSFNLDAAKKSFGIDNEGKVIKGGFVDKGGYMGGWYRQGVDVNQEVMAVSEDIKAGKSSLDVEYGMSKAGKERVEQRYKKQLKKSSDKDYLDAVDRGDMETAQRMVDEAAREAGYVPVSRYHQTGARFNKFSNDNPDAGLNDSETPNGYFFKENDHDIGVGADFVKTGHGGGIQMRVYLKHRNMLYFKNREEASAWYAKNVSGYRELLEKYDAHLKEFEEISSKNNKEMFDELIALEESGQSTTDKDLAIMDKYDKIMDEWIESRQEYETSLRAGMRNLLNKYFIESDSGYDGIELADDGHRYIDGKREDVHTYIVFKNTQIKSADPVTYDDNGDIIPLSERFNSEKSDIRYQKKKTSNRTILANALETTAQNDIEKSKLAQYKEKIALMDAEEEKLADIRAKIKELSFPEKGTKKDTEAIKKLQFEANKTANRINTYDRQLLNLESTTALKGVLEREKQKAYQRAEKKGKEALEAYREKMTKTQRELLTRYNDQRKAQREKATERKDKTTLRRKIRKLVKELNSLLKNGNKKKNIKQEMQDTVASSLALAEVLFNDDIKNEDIVRLGVASVTTKESEYLNKYRDLLDMRDSLLAEIESIYANGDVRETMLADVAKVDEKLKNVEGQIAYLNNKLSELFERERARLNKATVDAIIDDLVSEYSKLKDSENGYIKNAYSEGMKDRLIVLKEALKGTVAKDMNVYQLQELYDTFKAIEHMIRYSNSLFREGRTEDLMTNVSNMQGEIYEASTEQKDRNVVADTIARTLNEFSWNNLRPVDAVERLGSQTFEKLFWDFVHAMGVAARDITEAGEVIASAREKFGYSKWNMELADTPFTTRDGLTFKPSLADKLSIYAYSQREQAEDHMVEGGFTYDTGRTYKETENGKTYVRRKLSNTYRLSKEDIQTIIDSLTNEQRDYVDAILPYLTDMGKKGNEVSMTLYGIELFGEKVYFPLQSSKDYLSSTTQTLGATPTMASLANSGFTKQTKPHASNPIVLRGFDDVVLEHIEKMSNYHALVIPIENLRRVFDNVGRETEGMPISTKALIGSRFGVEAQKYFEQWLTDINGGITPSGAKSILGKLFSKAKGMSVAANLSVVAQQYFSIIRAMEVVNPKYFTPFLNGEAKKTDMKQYEELLKYAPIAIIKEMGGFDVGSRGRVKDYIGYEGARKDAKYLKKKVDDIWMWGAGKMDELGWVTIWKAVKAEVASEQKLTPGTEAFYEACRIRFTEVVTKTQVFDSVASRSGYMRSQHDAVKYATSFMGEPTAIVGRIFGAGTNLVRAYKSGNKARKKAAWARLGRTASVIVVANVLGKLAQSLVYGGRDDDEDEALLERWTRNFAEALAEDLKPYGFASYLPFGRDIVSLIEGYSVERPDMQLIEDVIKSFKSVTDGDITLDDSLKLVGSVGNFFGVPLKNIIREIKSAINVVGDVFDDIKPTDIGGAFVEGITGDERTKAEMLYNSIMSGDTERVAVIKATYKSETAYTTALRNALTENDPRIVEAVMAHYEGDIKKRASLTLEIEKEDNFSQNVVRGAINNEITRLGNKIKDALKAKETDTAKYKKLVKELREMYPKDFVEKMLKDTIVEEEEEESEDKLISMYKMDDYYDSIVRGNISTANAAKEDLIETDVANGKDRDEAEADFNSKFTSYLKEKYEDGDLSDYDAEDMLVSYASKSEEEAASKVQYWDFKMEYPDYDLSEEAVEKYYSKAKPSGINIDVYYDYSKQRAKCKGTDTNGDGKADSGSVKSEVLKVINSLPISSYQKDTLYYLNGWSASTLGEAPWH
jgi:hypothetical protein